MIIHCEECGKKYKIDDKKIVKDRTLFNCPNCKSTIEVLKPRSSVESLEPELSPPESSIDKAAASGAFQTVGKTSDAPVQRPVADWKMPETQLPETAKAKGLTVGKKLMLLFLGFILITGAILTFVYMTYVPSLMHDQINLRTYSISQSFSAAIQQPLLIKNQDLPPDLLLFKN